MEIVHSLGPAEIARLLSRHTASNRRSARDAGAQPSAFHQQSQPGVRRDAAARTDQMDAPMTSGHSLARTPPDTTQPRSIRRIASQQLMDGRREVIIEHGSEEYRLRLTGAGKLILTK